MPDPKYAAANLFVGKYAIPADGHIRLAPEARLRFLRGRELPSGWTSDPGGELWLIVEDCDFWPVMIRLEADAYPELNALYPRESRR